MRQLTDFTRTVQLTLLAAVLLSISSTMIGQQQPPAVSHPSTSSVQVTPRQAPSPYGNAPNPGIGVQRAQGAITGFVYWQLNILQPQSNCQGLTVKVATVTKSGLPLQLLSTTSAFTPMGPVTDESAPGMPKYMLCSYAFQNLPKNVALRVLLYGAPSSATVSMPSSFQIPGGNCNSTPSSTLSFILTGGQVLCGNGAFNINFKLTSAAGTPPRTTAPLLSGTPKPPGLLPNSGSTPNAANQGPPAESSSGAGTLLSSSQTNAGGQAPSRPRTGLLSSAQSGRTANTIAATAGQKNDKALPAADRAASHLPVTALNPGFHLTNFKPAIHGFRFVNSFVNDVVPSMDVRTGGLCGGMSYSALDYYFAHAPVPQQTYRPANRTTLQSYLYNREVQSLASNLDKWAEVGFNPGGSRNGEFFNWGLQGTNGGRLEELRSFIDQGTPAVIDLQGDGGTGNHQVVAFGYSMGRYQGDLKNFEDDLKIVVYDSNYPMKTRTLIPDVPNQLYRYAEGGPERWRTYFVDKNYHAQTPPSLPNPVYPNDGTVRELILSFHTGSDDMRGGNDNIDLAVDLLDGSRQLYPNVNLSARWLPNYIENARVILSTPVRPDQIHDLVLTDTFGGGMGGDNWDMNSVSVGVLVNGKISVATTFGFHRFSADSDGPKARTLTIPLN
jgi:hypothetical protein